MAEQSLAESGAAMSNFSSYGVAQGPEVNIRMKVDIYTEGSIFASRVSKLQLSLFHGLEDPMRDSNSTKSSTLGIPKASMLVSLF